MEDGHSRGETVNGKQNTAKQQSNKKQMRRSNIFLAPIFYPGYPALRAGSTPMQGRAVLILALYH